jgi:hypothetical protein
MTIKNDPKCCFEDILEIKTFPSICNKPNASNNRRGRKRRRKMIMINLLLLSIQFKSYVFLFYKNFNSRTISDQANKMFRIQ